MQLDLFSWGDNRPSAIVLDARARIEARTITYILNLPDEPPKDRKAADVVPLRPERGAA
ncbi:hypothetical protein [Agrobacterium tumefaciens]|uniref:hypothetical protein n=1 Tax=Agrobacterium tumefaciens TaxID=358 RepID=UPI001300E470|nr:hypothetical protein [Agrobacterium tumefaciens]NSL22829.1 hypothetical protein [Agrobacterium tumefaciens]NTC56784.1 hypothetical protein [Agrobacterium tumefaciens]NTC62562.1 hypothetical protein [Agrobacterium tumefaciens]NTC66292.1 hypothetical protein [Agrobacterium tumefaciens]NTC74872.1 hypothetical protein [Agrobacterium tumefaciens]